MKFKKLFIPGPTEVRQEVLERMSQPMIGHRSADFAELFNRVTPKLKRFLMTSGYAFMSTSSSTGLMEAAVRNCVAKRCLNVTCGAFGERWHSITLSCGLQADALSVEWGNANKPEQIDRALSTGKYDAMTLVLNETSTGVMNPYLEIAEVMKKYPDVMFLVDAVSGLGAVKIDADALGIDVCLAGVQKALALPPGLAVCSVSEKAMAKSEKAKNKGHYFDFVLFKKYAEKGQTPNTPVISIIYALDHQLDRIFEEGLENRFARHQQMAEYTRNWAKDRFDLFAEPGYESVTLTTVRNSRAISVADLSRFLAEKHSVLIANGYGRLKEKTFRIGHMGDLTLEEVKELLGWIDEYIGVKSQV